MNDDGKTVVPAEKWADHVEVIVASEEKAAALRAKFLGAFDEPYGVAEMNKTATERTLIAEALVALNEFRVGVCNLPAISVAEERVHILEPPDFVAVCGAGVDGKSLFGHIYLPGNERLSTFCFCLTHELVHVAGYLALRVAETIMVDTQGNRRISADEIRDGLLREDPTRGWDMPCFDGLNEAATEAAAQVVRAYLTRRTSLLDAQEKERVRKMASYEPQLVVCKKLAQVVTPAGWAEKIAWQTLFRDYMRGTDDFLHLAESWLPGAWNHLKMMGTKPFDAYCAAEALGFHEEAQAIRTNYLKF